VKDKGALLIFSFPLFVSVERDPETSQRVTVMLVVVVEAVFGTTTIQITTFLTILRREHLEEKMEHLAKTCLVNIKVLHWLH